MAQHEQTKTLPQDRDPVNFTMSALPFPIWKAVQDEATNRRVSAKQIWMEAACAYLNLDETGMPLVDASDGGSKQRKSARQPATY